MGVTGGSRRLFLPLATLTAILVLLALFAGHARGFIRTPSSSPFASSKQRTRDDQLLFSNSQSSSSTSTSQEPASPSWTNYSEVASFTRPVENAVLPIRLWHLDSLKVDKTFAPIWLASAFVDTRPRLVGASSEVALLAVGPTALTMDFSFNETPLVCYIIVQPKGRNSKTIHLTSRAAIAALPDAHIDLKKWAGVQIMCPIPVDDAVLESADVLVSLSTESHPPPTNVFKRAPMLPQFDPVAHKEGRGTGAVCLQPLIGNTYAPSMRDFIAYYETIGFSDFFVYLLDPAPETLAIIRDLAREHPGFKPIRWGLHLDWLDSRSPYRVDPRDWNVQGVPQLQAHEEYQYGYSGSNPPKQDVQVWAFAQALSHHDCSFRAKLNKNRWAAMVDWDEYLLLRPPSGSWPPPSRGYEDSLLGDWARTIDDEARTSLLPSAFLFQSAFLCPLCRPTPHSSSPQPERVKDVMSEIQVDLAHPTPAIPSILVSPVRQTRWFDVGLRSKAIIDVWAWYSQTIHQVVVSYAQYAASRCEAWNVGKQEDECWRAYSNYMRPSITLVQPPQVTNKTERIGRTDNALGAMYHLRAPEVIGTTLADWERRSRNEGLELFSAPEGSAMMDEVRVEEYQWTERVPGEADLSEGFVEDWTLIETMLGFAVSTVKERRLKPLRRWTGHEWVGSASSLEGAGGTTFYHWAGLVAGLLAVFHFVGRRLW
ncbi:hypothetical protein T439DRAFT_324412 [Meredithblackwellia eburnea MCA 4105]